MSRAAGARRREVSMRRAARAFAVLLMVGLGACAGERRPVETAATAPDPPAGPVVPASLIADIPPEIAPNRPRIATRVLVHPWVSPADRGEATIATVDDLVIDERPGERRYDFDNAVNVVTDAAGRMYVHDSGGYRVIAYAPDGSFARQYGSLDDAPFHLGWIAWSGGRLAISTGLKVALFAPNGDPLADRSLLRHAFGRDVRGTDDGSLVGSFGARDRANQSWYSVEKRSLDADDGFTYWAARVPARGSSDPTARPGFAATRGGELYFTRGDEYAIQAFDADGTARWILYVETPAALVAADRPGPGPPALSVPGAAPPGVGHALRVDGRGNLYVFPYPGEPTADGRIPVDVYAPDGARLFAGWIEPRSWIAARGDFIYGIEGDEGAQRVVRYRLQAPFLPAVPVR